MSYCATGGDCGVTQVVDSMHQLCVGAYRSENVPKRWPT